MKGTDRNKRKAADRRRAREQRTRARCASCGAAASRHNGPLDRQGAGGKPLCRACARKQDPELARADRAMELMKRDRRRIGVLWRSAHCEPTAFHVLEGDRPGRRGSGPVNPKQASIRLREAEELLESESAVQVFIAAQVPEDEAAVLLTGIADRLRRGGYALRAD